MRNSLINRALVAKTKLFNYALLAAALLVGVNVNAATVTTAADLQAALNAALDNDVVLFAPADADDASYNQEIKFYNPGKTVTLDLNGKTYTATHAGVSFGIYGGTLIVKNGTLTSTYGTKNGKAYGFRVHGFDQPQNDKISKLVIEKDVFVNMPLGGAAVCVDVRDAVAKIGETVVDLPSTKGLLSGGGHGVAENVFVEIYGHLKGGKYGAQVTGNVRYPKGDMDYVQAASSQTLKNNIINNEAAYIANVPKITIHPSAIVEGGLNYDSGHNGIGVYAAGYAEWTISGEIFGATGVYVKCGKVTLKDANIYSIWTGEYQPAEATTSGAVSGGSGVVVESSTSYAGKINVTVEGDTKIEGNTGYGIEQAITNGSPEQLNQLNIKGGEIAAGDKGTVVIEAANKADVTITAGSSEGETWEVKNNATGETQTIAITEFIPKNDEGQAVSHKVEILDADGNVATTVIVPGPAPTKITEEQCGSFNLNNLAENDGIDFGDCDKAQELTKDLVLGEIIMNSKDNAQTITIPEGKTLTVKYLLMGGKSKIIVEAGGMLIVSGGLGVKNVSTDNIIIKAEVNNSGQFLFAPEVVSNKHPKATVEYKTEAINGKRDRIGVPAYDGMQFKEIVREYPLSMLIFDNAIGWVPVTSVEQYLAPFQGLTISSTATSATTLKFPCELVGNTDADLKFYASWNTFSNSYTANADLTPFLQEQINLGDDALLEATIHKYNPTNLNNHWDAVSFNDITEGLGDGVLKPMQAIVIRNKTTKIGNVNLSYEHNVWAKRPNAPATPSAPKFVQTNVNKAVINITSANGMTDKLTIREADQYTEQFDNGSDATKYPNNLFNMYVATEFGDLCQLASNNVEGQVITLATTTETEFTMSFSNVRGEKMALVDNMTGDVIEMAEGVTYNFIANANEVSERFTVVAAAQAPTALKKAEASTKAAKFINNGQVILQNNGRMFNVLGIEVK